MKHLKHFEAVHYGDKHFGQLIKDYFPWYRHNTHHYQSLDKNLLY